MANPFEGLRIAKMNEAQRRAVLRLTLEQRRDLLVLAGQVLLRRDAAMATGVSLENENALLTLLGEDEPLVAASRWQEDRSVV